MVLNASTIEATISRALQLASDEVSDTCLSGGESDMGLTRGIACIRRCSDMQKTHGCRSAHGQDERRHVKNRVNEWLLEANGVSFCLLKAARGN